MKFKKEWLIWIVGILFVMSIMPGEGTKMAGDQQAIIKYTEYTCTQDSDCPTCIGGGIVPVNESKSKTELGFFEELSYSECNDDGVCELSDACIVWDCGQTQENCNSVKKTVLENTIEKMNANPMIFLFIIGLLVAFLML